MTRAAVDLAELADNSIARWTTARVKALAEQITEGTRVWCNVDDTAVECSDLNLGIEVAADLDIAVRDDDD
ncbi:hypothetical protein [Prescottella equi]